MDNVVAAARALYELAVSTAETTRPVSMADQLHAQHGPGVFYLLLVDADAVAAYVADPAIDTRTVYCDREKCQALAFPDVTLGALAAERARAVVVVDQLVPGYRCSSDSHAQFTCASVQLAKLDVPSGTRRHSVSMLTAEETERVERAVQQRRPPGQHLVYAELGASDCDDGGSVQLDVVPRETAISTLRDMQQGAPAAPSMDLIVTLLDTCPPTSVVVWARKADGEADLAWHMDIGTGTE